LAGRLISSARAAEASWSFQLSAGCGVLLLALTGCGTEDRAGSVGGGEGVAEAEGPAAEVGAADGPVDAAGGPGCVG